MEEKSENGNKVQHIHQIGKEIISVLMNLRVEQSFSFVLNEEGHQALQALVDLTEEKMPKNMTRLLESAMETLSPLTNFEPGDPLNVNLNEDDLKAMEKIMELIERNWEVET